MKVVTLDSIVGVIRERRGQKKFLHKFIEECEIVNAIPIPDNATNGDVIKAMFPNEEFKQGEDGISKLFMKMNMDDVGYASLHKSWWNAPYKKGVEE